MGGFGERIRELRQAKEMTLRKLAEEVDMSAPYLSRIESGREYPPRDRLIHNMAAVLGCEVSELLDLASKERPDRIAADVTEAARKNETFRQKVPEFLRTAANANLKMEDWNKLIKEIQDSKEGTHEDTIPDN